MPHIMCVLNETANEISLNHIMFNNDIGIYSTARKSPQ